jgi:hypothetical protein
MTDQDIVNELRTSAEDDGRVTCATMHGIARKLGVEPIEVGNVASEADVHASQCQLGLFGHSPRGQGKGRIVRADVEVSDELAEQMRAALVDGRLPCAAAWDIATELKLKRLDLGNAAETLDLSIAPCQLGFF